MTYLKNHRFFTVFGLEHVLATEKQEVLKMHQLDFVFICKINQPN